MGPPGKMSRGVWGGSSPRAKQLRLRLLDELAADVDRIYAGGTPESPVMRAMAETVSECGVPAQPLLDLIQANRQDQQVTRYPTYADLERYCELSANPVGQIVLYIFGVATPGRIALSDNICTALQLAEHWQDVAEDLGNGRIYLPGEDLERFGCTEADLAAPAAGPAVRQLMTFETDRASRLLDQGAPLVGTLRGSARLAVAGYLAGGRAALAAIRRQHYDVLTRDPARPQAAAGGRTGQGVPEREVSRRQWTSSRRTASASGSPGRRRGTSPTASGCCHPPKRRGLAVIYAFARRIDDIGDGVLPSGRKIADLESARQAVLNLDGADLDGNGRDDPVLLALADVKRNFPVPMEAFGELIDGCVADVRGTHYETFEDLHYYCRCVAGSIGRLSLGIFGTSHDLDEAARLADSLGVALQLTNILRDIREDHQNGRIYLPAEDLAKFDVDLNTPNPSQFTRLVEFEAERARDWYATGWRLLPMLDRRSAACTGAMAGIYRQLLEQIAAQPGAVLDRRVSLSTGEKAMVAVRALAGRIR